MEQSRKLNPYNPYRTSPAPPKISGDFFLLLPVLSGAISGLPAALFPLRVRALHVILQFAIRVEGLMANFASLLLFSNILLMFVPDVLLLIVLLLIVRILRHKQLPLL
jgi:hypothetical protein